MVDDAKDILIETNKSNLEVLEALVTEFSNEFEFNDHKTKHFLDNSPFDALDEVVDKTFEDIYKRLNKEHEKIKGNLNNVRQNYVANLHQNVNKINKYLNKTKEALAKVTDHLNESVNLDSLLYCEKAFENNITAEVIEVCKQATAFQKQEFLRLKQNFVDTNTVVFNDSIKEIEKAKQFREFIVEQIESFSADYRNWTARNVYTVIMRAKEFIVYLCDENKVVKVTYDNDFTIPNYSRWINVTGNKLLLTGGEKDNIESTSNCYLFIFGAAIDEEESINAAVTKIKNMNQSRRAHSLISINDYMWLNNKLRCFRCRQNGHDTVGRKVLGD